ncbi:hypothetical protein ZWY2020_022203 [Hordeum vulgare]|nr:hypothetical protein ZWY2020_022203 [Hordeum vulgare]
MALLAPSMLRHLDPSRRHRESRSTTVLSPALDQAVFFLRSHAVTLFASDGVNVSSPMTVGRHWRPSSPCQCTPCGSRLTTPSTSSSPSRSQLTR